jgi:hypothetical protein
MSRGSGLPINFAEIKQARAPKDPNQRVYLLAACLFLVLLLGGLVVGMSLLDRTKKQIAMEGSRLMDLDKQLIQEREKRTKLQALYDWEQVIWPDELYELARALPPASKAFRVKVLKGDPDRATVPVAPGAKKDPGPPPIDDLNARPIARLYMELTAPGDKELNEVGALLLESGRDEHGSYYRPEANDLSRSGYKKGVKIRRRPPTEFKAVIGDR